MSIGIVTDSASDLPDELTKSLGIKVVPAALNIGEDSFIEGVDISRKEFYAKLSSYKSPPATAAPSTLYFARAYEELTAEGATEIISMHLASAHSGIFNAARLGVDSADSAPVTLFDSGQLTLGLGLMVVEAAKKIEENLSIDGVINHLESLRSRTFVFAAIDTLEYLRRGGRVGWTEFGLGTLLKYKPIMRIHDGEISMVERVRTRAGSIAKLVEIIRGKGALEQLGFIHVDAVERVEKLRVDLIDLVEADYKPIMSLVTPVIGSHVGPGAIGAALIVAE